MPNLTICTAHSGMELKCCIYGVEGRIIQGLLGKAEENKPLEIYR
jgi:hypothetical protein